MYTHRPFNLTPDSPTWLKMRRDRLVIERGEPCVQCHAEWHPHPRAGDVLTHATDCVHLAMIDQEWWQDQFAAYLEVATDLYGQTDIFRPQSESQLIAAATRMWRRDAWYDATDTLAEG